MTEKIKVLIVDDIKDTRDNLRRLLQFEEEITVIGDASNGQEAVVQVKQFRPDIILMDINMPGMDGIQATEKISVDFPQIGIIILSVQGEQEYLRKAMSAGARGYLIKPPSNDELIHTIYHVYELGLKGSQGSAVGEEHVREEDFKMLSNSNGIMGKRKIKSAFHKWFN